MASLVLIVSSFVLLLLLLLVVLTLRLVIFAANGAEFCRRNKRSGVAEIGWMAVLSDAVTCICMVNLYSCRVSTRGY
jgi:hypothetical protein